LKKTTKRKFLRVKRKEKKSFLRNFLKLSGSRESSGSSPEPVNHNLASPLSSFDAHKLSVFGMDLVSYSKIKGELVPQVVQSCINAVEARGMVLGIYRLSGNYSAILKLKGICSDDTVVDLTALCGTRDQEGTLYDIHCISGLLKLYFRELPNPLITFNVYEELITIFRSHERKTESGNDEDIIFEFTKEEEVKIVEILKKLPPPHFAVSQMLVKHLLVLLEHQEKNTNVDYEFFDLLGSNHYDYQ